MTKEERNKRIADKRQELDGLVEVVKLNQRITTHKEKEALEAVEYGLKVRLDDLVLECKERELDTKILCIKKTIAILKGDEKWSEKE